ncbi:hypothetical protein NNC19_13785 [Clostridium sp. SHJSY1]|uniref:hypothetical protein n=1 Tax=Clostridium sp. SHJSY1 TaxID=2942483 RepID=UPI002876DBAB|nr:hypothetical protein [Clostridium sp. SHJSY1]MDS0526758.1 hypothetical protein [Clostridium sp. SHJSY1]
MQVWEKYYEECSMPQRFELEALVNDKNGLKLRLSDYESDNKFVDIIFKDGPVAYRCLDEVEYLKTMNYLNNTYESEYFEDCKIFKVKNSEFMEWIKNESFETFDCESKGCEQYVIFTVKEVIEVITCSKPELLIYQYC